MYLLYVLSSPATLTGAEKKKTGPSRFRPDFWKKFLDANYEGGKQYLSFKNEIQSSPAAERAGVRRCLILKCLPLTPALSPFGGERESDIKDATTGCGFDLTIHRVAVKNFRMSCTLLTL
jgi:hypothetical protein